MHRIASSFARHPLLRDALYWALPAIFFGLILRGCLLHYSPYGYWGADSRSYYDFAYKLFTYHEISMGEKRRGLYPVFMAFLTLLPGAPLRWLPWLQHAFGLLTLWPLAYVVRKNFTAWRWWVIPVTLLYTGFPILLWYEHELLGETLFFSFLVWAFAGWSAWAEEGRQARARRLWWCFFVPFACFILVRPAGRFYWPGLVLGAAIVGLWRKVTLPAWAGLAVLAVVTLLLGSEKQGAWLVYTAVFPLTQTETRPHADYKAQIRDLVKPLHDDLSHYYSHDEVPFNFLENPDRSPERTLWAPLKGQTPKRIRLYLDLAEEGVRAEPLNFLSLGFQRAVFSSNLSTFKKERFNPTYLPRRFQDDYQQALARAAAGEHSPVEMVLGHARGTPFPPYAELEAKFNPAPDSFAVRLVRGWVDAWDTRADLISAPRRASASEARPTIVGCLLLLSTALAFTPRYRKTVGVWILGAFGYVGGVFLISQVNPRYFGAAWPVFIPTLAVAGDWLTTFLRSRLAGRAKAPRPDAGAAD